MFLDKKARNRYTIGKQLRKYKQLRKKDPTAELVPMPHQLQMYSKQLIQKGLEVKGLKFAMFKTKNGLKYPGLIATEQIKANTILIKCPVQLLLTTRDAYLSDIQKIFQENPQYFAKRFSSQWEDRILLAYLLYEHQKGEKSRWFNLIRNLPKEIDYAVFWQKDEIEKLEDSWFGEHIKNQRSRFEQDCSKLIQILKNYPQFFDKTTISRQNIIWIHTHLVTRCFGKYFQYTTMVPFAQLFNHECTDVYYTMYYHPDNPHNEHEQFYDEQELTQQQMEECDSSDGSYDADDFYLDDEMVPFSQELSNNWEKQFEGKQQILKDVKGMKVHIFTFIHFSDSVSLNYLSLMLNEIKVAINGDKTQVKAKLEQIHSVNVRYIKKVKEFYSKNTRKYYSYGVKQKRKTQQKGVEDKPVKGQQYFQKQWPKDKFDKFYMLCSTKDQFQQGSQVFFCYGRLPNKLLLMRYGFALQHNKYDHFFLKINVTQMILGDPNLKEVMPEIQINKYRRFKIKRTKICVELITYFRSFKWQWGQRFQLYFAVCQISREIETLLETKQFIQTYLKKQYSSSLQENQQKLTDKKLGYHQHFALIYKIEQQRILQGQITMINYALQVLQQIKQGNELRDILLSEKQTQKLTLQIMMEKYFKLFETKLT